MAVLRHTYSDTRDLNWPIAKRYKEWRENPKSQLAVKNVDVSR